ncbi:MAG: hypothetical protein ACI9S8_000712 [Chlamydiales bacterium]|jgi:hypothetical protein
MRDLSNYATSSTFQYNGDETNYNATKSGQKTFDLARPPSQFICDPEQARSTLFSKLPGTSTDDKFTDPITQHAADLFVRELYKINDFAWDFKKDACYARASLAIDKLKQIGIPKDLLTLQVIIGPNLGYISSEKEKVIWQYHIASSIELNDGSRVIIDPSVDSKKALNIKDWAFKISHDQSILPSISTFIPTDTDASFVADLSKHSFVHIPADGDFHYTRSNPSQLNYFIKKQSIPANLVYKDIFNGNKRKVAEKQAQRIHSLFEYILFSAQNEDVKKLNYIPRKSGDGLKQDEAIVMRDYTRIHRATRNVLHIAKQTRTKANDESIAQKVLEIKQSCDKLIALLDKTPLFKKQEVLELYNSVADIKVSTSSQPWDDTDHLKTPQPTF